MLNFIKNNQNIMFCKADNVTVTLDRSDYDSGVKLLLNDKDMYEITNHNPVKKLKKL